MEFLFSAGFSEDSDYTSDFNFPVNGQIPNAATSQYLHTPRGATAAAGATASSSENQANRGGQEDPHYEAQVLLYTLFLILTFH